MRFSDDFIEELKSRLRPSDVIGRRVKLRRQGREFVGLSPFNKEKTPSFFVNDEKGRFFDFSSGKNGDVIGFVQEMEGLSFAEAVERLAGEAGMALPAPDPEAAKREEARKGLIHWIEAAQDYFTACLRRTSGAVARDYLAGRGLPPDVWADFGIGWAPDSRTGLSDHLVARGARPAELVEAGLVFQPEDGSGIVDRFRGRVMFPIQDPRGRLVGFGGRALNKDAKAKYLNSPDTPLFHKGSLLYRFPEARKAANDPKGRLHSLIIAEGYLDVIAFARAGLPQAVAPLGTALTEDQIRLAWRAGPEPILCFDGDAAGKRAAYRAIDRALPMLEPGKSLRFVLLDGGKDPDDMMRDEGPGALRAALDQTRPLVDLLWEREREAEPLDTPERRAGLKRRLFAAIAVISDDSVREEYRSELLGRFDRLHARPAPRPQGRGRGRNTGRGWDQKPAAFATEELKRKAAGGRGTSMVLGALAYGALAQPALLEACAEELTELDFGDPGLNRLRDAGIAALASGEAVDKQGLHSHLARLGFGDLLARLESEKRLYASAYPDGLDDPEKAERSWRALYDGWVLRHAAAQERAYARRLFAQDPSAANQNAVRGALELERRMRSSPQEEESAGRSEAARAGSGDSE